MINYIIKDLIKIILFIISSVMKWALQPVLFAYGIIRSLSKGLLANYLEHLAIAKDKYGNTLGSELFNDVLITRNGYKFGNNRQTISAIIGYNRVRNTLTWLGLLIYKILNRIQVSHCEKAVLSDKEN